jgi:hypothetical protein
VPRRSVLFSRWLRGSIPELAERAKGRHGDTAKGRVRAENTSSPANGWDPWDLCHPTYRRTAPIPRRFAASPFRPFA